MKSLVLIDGNAIIHRAYHSMPKNLSTRDGELTNAVYGFALTLIRVLEDLKPDYIISSFDLAGPTFRHEKFKDYKATRVKADQELYDQIPRVKELITALGIKIIEKQGFEADDIIGTTVKRIRNHQLQDGIEIKTYIVTGDKDVYQLVNGKVVIYDLRKGLGQPRLINKQKIKQDYDLEPEDFVDLKALSGDASDNIPGVPGIGDKTATELLKKYKTLDGIYKNLDSAEIKPRIKDLLIQYKEQAYLSRELATIDSDVPVDFTLKDIEWGDYDREAVRNLFEELGFRSLIARFGRNADTNQVKTKSAEETKKKDRQLKLL